MEIHRAQSYSDHHKIISEVIYVFWQSGKYWDCFQWLQWGLNQTKLEHENCHIPISLKIE